MTDLRPRISKRLQEMAGAPLRAASLALLDTLGYHSDKTIVLPDSKPDALIGQSWIRTCLHADLRIDFYSLTVGK